MFDQYQGVKELNKVVLKAKVPMQFGERQLEIGESVLYFEKVNMSLLTEQNNPIMARGGWGNMPHVIWEDRSEIRFTLSEGVMSSISMGVLLSAAMSVPSESLMIPTHEVVGELELTEDEIDELDNIPFGETNPNPIPYENRKFIGLSNLPHLIGKKAFIYTYQRNVAQKKVYGVYKKYLETQGKYIVELTPPFESGMEYLVDYYYKYSDNALVYMIQKERFNGLFTLEGMFYSKDENEGKNYPNLIYMPKVRIVSDISLRLGERADPTTAVFNIIGMPETTDESRNLILKITRLDKPEE